MLTQYLQTAVMARRASTHPGTIDAIAVVTEVAIDATAGAADLHDDLTETTTRMPPAVTTEIASVKTAMLEAVAAVVVEVEVVVPDVTEEIAGTGIGTVATGAETTVVTVPALLGGIAATCSTTGAALGKTETTAAVAVEESVAAIAMTTYSHRTDVAAARHLHRRSASRLPI